MIVPSDCSQMSFTKTAPSGTENIARSDLPSPVSLRITTSIWKPVFIIGSLFWVAVRPSGIFSTSNPSPDFRNADPSARRKYSQSLPSPTLRSVAQSFVTSTSTQTAMRRLSDPGCIAIGLSNESMGRTFSPQPAVLSAATTTIPKTAVLSCNVSMQHPFARRDRRQRKARSAWGRRKRGPEVRAVAQDRLSPIVRYLLGRVTCPSVSERRFVTFFTNYRELLNQVHPKTGRTAQPLRPDRPNPRTHATAPPTRPDARASPRRHRSGLRAGSPRRSPRAGRWSG